MFPLTDVEANRYTGIPLMTLLLIVVNLLILVFQDVLIESNFDAYLQLINLFGTVPALILIRQGGGGLSSLTSMFLHGGLFHLLSNMLALWVFGRRVEDACGPWRFLGFYLACGLFADIVSTFSRADSMIPGIGASGALYGVMAAYLMLYPRGRIRTLIILIIIPVWPRIRAYWVILYFVLLEIPRAYNVLMFDAPSNVGHWAHLGGFIGGLFIFIFLRPDAFHRYRNELPL